MAALIRWFIGNRVAPNLLMLTLLVTGFAAMFSITVKTFPDIATGTISVSVVFPGATPQEVADAVIVPIENAVEGLAGIRKISSTATAGLATIALDLLESADLREVIRDVETEVERLTVLPERAERPQIVEVEPDELAAQIALTGASDRDTLKTLGERVRRELLALPAVSQVELIGVAPDRIDIVVDRDTLDAYGLAIDDISTLVAAESVDLSGGRIDSEQERILLRAVGESSTAAGYREKPVVVGEDGTVVRLGDIAEVIETRTDDTRIVRFGDRPGVLLSVNRVGDEQVLGLVEAVQGYLDDTLTPSLPPDIEATLWRDEAESLAGRVRLLAENGAIGVTLIVLILLLFIDLRVAVWVGAGVAVAFIGTFALMQSFGVTINQLSLFGFILALGIVVDDAIVVGEAVYREQASEADDGNPLAATQRAVMRVWKPITFSVTTTIFAFLPLLLLPGSSGQFIGDIAAVVILVLIVSLVESLFILPHHLSHIGKREPRRWSPRRLSEPLRRKVGGAFDRFAEGRLRQGIQLSVRYPLVALAGALAISIASFSLLSSGVVRFVFFPEIEGNYVTASLELSESATAEATARTAEQIVTAARATAESLAEESDGAGSADDLLVETLLTVGFASSGQGGGAGGGVPFAASVQAKLADADSRALPASDFASAWREKVGEIPGARKLTFSASTVGIGEPVVLNVSSDRESGTDAAVQRIVQALNERQGVFDVRDGRYTSAREIRVIARPAAAAYGLSQRDIALAVRNAFFGARVTEIQRDREAVDVRVRLVERQRDAIADLERLRIPVADGFVPLTAVAVLEIGQAPSTIDRVDGQRVTTVTADVDTAITTGGAETGYILSEIVPELQNDFPGLSVILGGEQEEQSRFIPALASNFALALFGIYAVLALAFGSYGRPFIVLAVIPFGFVGALLGHAALGLNLTLLSLFGVIGLSGVIVNDALLIVDSLLRDERNGKSPREAIVDAAVSRIRPIVLTTLTTFFGIAPLILETSVQAQFLVPTAVALGIGILFGSAMLLLLVPALASLYARARARLKSNARGFDQPADEQDEAAPSAA